MHLSTVPTISRSTKTSSDAAAWCSANSSIHSCSTFAIFNAASWLGSAQVCASFTMSIGLPGQSGAVRIFRVAVVAVWAEEMIAEPTESKLCSSASWASSNTLPVPLSGWICIPIFNEVSSVLCDTIVFEANPRAPVQ